MIEKLLKYKNQILFGASLFLFVFSLVYVLFVCFSANKYNGTPDEPIEVSLPVINWQKYYSLSKKLPNDIFK